MKFSKFFKSAVVGILSIAALFTGYKVLASTIPIEPSVYETYLSSQMGTSDTSLTLASGTLRDGTTLSGYACLTIDTNTSTLEYVCGTANGTSVTNLTRGIDPTTGTTSVASLIYSHRRGADVKITDYPILTIIGRILSGVDTLPTPISYTTHPTFTNTTQIVDKKYVDDTAFSGAGVINANTSSRGVVQIATGIQIASSTGTCSSTAPCAITADNATSTYNSATAALKVVVTQNNGKIDSNFIATSTLGLAYASSTVGKNIQVFTTTGTSTFSVPTGITKLNVRLVAGGGNGANSTSVNGSSCAGGTGGGSGGYAEKMVDVTGTSTIQLYVGAAGAWSTFGTNGFYFYANPGSNGSSWNSPGGGGTAVNGDVNSNGTKGQGSIAAGATGNCLGGSGASSPLGGGGGGGAGGSSGTGGAGGIGAGGGGAGATADGNTNTGGAGGQGEVIVTW